METKMLPTADRSLQDLALHVLHLRVLPFPHVCSETVGPSLMPLALLLTVTCRASLQILYSMSNHNGCTETGSAQEDPCVLRKPFQSRSWASAPPVISEDRSQATQMLAVPSSQERCHPSRGHRLKSRDLSQISNEQVPQSYWNPRDIGKGRENSDKKWWE